MSVSNKPLRSEKDIDDLYNDLGKIKESLLLTTRDVKSIVNTKYKKSLADVAEYASERPFACIGVAALTGFLLGLLFKK